MCARLPKLTAFRAENYVGNSRGYSIREVVETARRVTGLPIPAVEAPRRPGDPAVLVADASKLKRTLNWEPRYSTLEAILSTAWKWKQAIPKAIPRLRLDRSVIAGRVAGARLFVSPYGMLRLAHIMALRNVPHALDSCYIQNVFQNDAVNSRDLVTMTEPLSRG